jgi:hypothetical protein
MAAEQSATHHLKLAKLYLDDANRLQASEKHYNKHTSAIIVQTLSRAAEQLIKAREIDPNENLWMQDTSGKPPFEVTQDLLNSMVLTSEGLASYYAALHVNDQNDSYYSGVGTNRQAYLKEGLLFLHEARDALEKSLIYTPYREYSLTLLSKVYRALGDSVNYKRILEKRIAIRPNDIEAHKELSEIDTHDKYTYFKGYHGSLSSSEDTVLPILVGLVGVSLLFISITAGVSGLTFAAVLMIVAPIAYVYHLRD